MVLAVVRLSESYYIEDGIYKYDRKPDSLFGDIDYNILFDVLKIPDADRFNITFGYTRVNNQPIEFDGDNDRYLLVDLSKCKYYNLTEYYTWTDAIFYSMESDKYEEERLENLKRLAESVDNVDSRASKVQATFVMTVDSGYRELTYSEVESLYSDKNITDIIKEELKW